MRIIRRYPSIGARVSDTPPAASLNRRCSVSYWLHSSTWSARPLASATGRESLTGAKMLAEVFRPWPAGAFYCRDAREPGVTEGSVVVAGVGRECLHSGRND